MTSPFTKLCLAQQLIDLPKRIGFEDRQPLVEQVNRSALPDREIIAELLRQGGREQRLETGSPEPFQPVGY